MPERQAQHFDPSILPTGTSHSASVSDRKASLEAESLKKEGNRLHGLGLFDGAVSKYEAAIQALQGM